MSAEQHEISEIDDLTIAVTAVEIKNRLTAAEFDCKILAAHRQDGSHPNLLEV